MTKKQTTIKDIARRLNIHHTTVSRALRNHPDVKAETRDRILATARKMEYHPNTLAANLRNNQSKTIGIIVPNIHHYYFSNIISIIADRAARQGFAVLIFQSNENYRQEIQNILTLLNYRVAGVMISVSQETKSTDHFAQLQKLGIPIVNFDRTIGELDVNKIVINNREASFQAVEYLISTACRKIAHITTSNQVSIFKERLLGYKDALMKYNIPVRDDRILFTGIFREDGYQGTAELLKKSDRPDAIFAINDEVALGALECLEQHGIRVPDEISLIGFDDDRLAGLIKPSLTTVAQPVVEMGNAVFDQLMKDIKNKGKSRAKEATIIKARLIIRESTKKLINRGTIA